MDRILNYTISAADNGMVVLDFLRKQGFSRHILTAMKSDKEALSRKKFNYYQKSVFIIKTNRTTRWTN